MVEQAVFARADAGAVSSTLRIVHVITGLGAGGAERTLCRLAAELAQSGCAQVVVSLGAGDALAGAIRSLGVPVVEVPVRHVVRLPLALIRLTLLLRKLRPDVVQTWMYHSDLLGGLAAWLARAPVVVWGVRSTALHPGASRSSTRLVARACAVLSRRVPDAIVCCAESALHSHAALGYERARMRVIHNGLPLPDEPLPRDVARSRLGLPGDAFIVGRVGRFHPVKGYDVLLRSAARLRESIPDVDIQWVLCGEGVDEGNAELRSLVADAGLRGQVRLLGFREDMGDVYPALDVCVSTSLEEGFPNVLLEAMSYGVPIVATDVGASKWIVADAGRVVGVGDADAIARALADLLALEGRGFERLCDAARARARDEFGVERMAANYLALYEELRAAVRGGCPA